MASDRVVTQSTALRSFQWVNTRPWLTYDSNRTMWWSVTSLVGAVHDDHQSSYVTHDERIRTLLFHVGTQSFLGYLSHEFAHLHVNFTSGGVGDIHWAQEGVANLLPKPLYFARPLRGEFSYYGRMSHVSAGINQQEMNAQYLSREVVAHDDLPPDLAMSYVLNRFFQPLYVLIDDHREQGDKPHFDPFVYRTKLNKSNVGYTDERLHFPEHFLLPLTTALLSGRTIDSLSSVIHYVRGGGNHYQPYYVALAGMRVYLPDFQVLWHPDGLWLNMDLPIRDVVQTGDLLSLDGGMGVAGGLEMYRFGAKHRGVRLWNTVGAPEVGVGGYYSVRPRYRHEEGYLAQATVQLHPTPQMTLEWLGQLSYFDPIEHEIKGIGANGQIVGIPVLLKGADMFLSGFLTFKYDL